MVEVEGADWDFLLCWPLFFTYLFAFLWSKGRVLLCEMLKNMEQGTRETDKIVETAARILWEVLKRRLRESLLQHPGSDCTFISEDK